MEPSPFVRVTVESLAVKLPAVTRPAGPGVHPSTTPCFCTFRIPDVVPSQAASASLPLANDPTDAASSASAPSTPVVISFGPDAVRRLAGKPACLVVTVYAGRSGSTCGASAGRAMGRVRVGVDVEGAGKVGKGVGGAHSGWAPIGSGSGAMLHLVVRVEPDPRFVFQFGGEPECSPVVYQVQGSGIGSGLGGGGCVRQPVFSCRFSADRRRSSRSRNNSPQSPVDEIITSLRHSSVPESPAVQADLRVQQAKKFAVAQAQQEGFLGNYRSFDSPFGNYLVPVIPNRADLFGK